MTYYVLTNLFDLFEGIESLLNEQNRQLIRNDLIEIDINNAYHSILRDLTQLGMKLAYYVPTECTNAFRSMFIEYFTNSFSDIDFSYFMSDTNIKTIDQVLDQFCSNISISRDQITGIIDADML